MGLFSFFKKDKKGPDKSESPPLSHIQQIAKKSAIRLHRTRIDNLRNELEGLSTRLENVELDFDTPKQIKEKESDTLIRRMILLKYEIEIREGLVKWLS